MSWLAPVRRSRSQRGAVAGHTPTVHAPASLSGTAVLEPPASSGERDDASARVAQRGPFQISRTRPGRYTIADESGRQIGTILGDHVIGYTVRTGDRTYRFAHLDEVRLALELEPQAETETHAWGPAAEHAASDVA